MASLLIPSLYAVARPNPPAYKDTFPAVVILLTTLFPVSVTYIILLESIVILVGLLNLAAAPWPSTKPEVPLVPTNTLTVPVAPESPVIFLTQ